MILLIRFIALLAIINYSTSAFPLKQCLYSINIPFEEKRVELIEIKEANTSPIFYLRVNREVFVGKPELVEGSVIRWYKGYIEQADSVRLADFFEDHKLDSAMDYGREMTLHMDVATYYSLKKIKHSEYRILKQWRITANWWDDFTPWSGELIEVN